MMNRLNNRLSLIFFFALAVIQLINAIIRFERSDFFLASVFGLVSVVMFVVIGLLIRLERQIKYRKKPMGEKSDFK